MFIAYLTFPKWITPEIIPGIQVGSWYGLMYIFSFATAYFLFKRLAMRKENPLSKDDISNYTTWVILGLIIGARLFSVLIYADDRLHYWSHPWLIFWPFSGGQFTGLRGMSYHGGVVGGIVAAVIYSRVKKHNFWEIGDLLIAGLPLGYTFGRLGNFINQELYGRVTTSPIGMIFSPQGMEKFIKREDPWSVEIAQQLDISILGWINLPRHPSQLYEALFEGVVLWLILWFVVRRFKKYNGQILGSYLLGYGFFRFFIEYFRQPDANLGYIINFSGRSDLILAMDHPLGAISLGQILCAIMIISGIVLIFTSKWLDEGTQKRVAARILKGDGKTVSKPKYKISKK